MAVSEFAKKYHEKMFPGRQFVFERTDPEFSERFENFAFDEVVNQDDLDDKTRFMAILASLIGCQGEEAFCIMVPAAMQFGVTPVEVKEIVYQATAYLGMGRVYPFLKVVNEIFAEQGIPLPMENRALQLWRTAAPRVRRRRLIFLGKECAVFGSQGPRSPGIFIYG